MLVPLTGVGLNPSTATGFGSGTAVGVGGGWACAQLAIRIAANKRRPVAAETPGPGATFRGVAVRDTEPSPSSGYLNSRNTCRDQRPAPGAERRTTNAITRPASERIRMLRRRPRRQRLARDPNGSHLRRPRESEHLRQQGEGLYPILEAITVGDDANVVGAIATGGLENALSDL